MKINLIRHGQTSGNLESRYIGTTDEPLCSAGMEALRRRRYPAHGVLICSPMKRCIQTAQAIYPGVKPIIMHELRECDFGAFEGKNYRELNGDPDYQRWIDSGGYLPFPGGESPEKFRARCCAGFARAVAENHSVDIITFVVHGGTIMALLSHFLGGEYFDYQAKCGQGYSGILVFPMGGGAPECKDFHPLSKSGLSEFTKGETY